MTEAIPKVLSGRLVDETGRYACPLCNVQRTGDAADTGWVSCPLVADDYVCLGCCLDHQSVARSFDFDGHPYRDLFDELETMSGSDASECRRTCLSHQMRIIHEQLIEAPENEELQRFKELLSLVATTTD